MILRILLIKTNGVCRLCICLKSKIRDIFRSIALFRIQFVNQQTVLTIPQELIISKSEIPNSLPGDFYFQSLDRSFLRLLNILDPSLFVCFFDATKILIFQI